MKRPIYEKLAAYGHFGRKDIKLEDCLWESIKYFWYLFFFINVNLF